VVLPWYSHFDVKLYSTIHFPVISMDHGTARGTGITVHEYLGTRISRYSFAMHMSLRYCARSASPFNESHS
jgi:hypothetical protein